MNTKDDAGTTFAADVTGIIRRLTSLARRTYTTPDGQEQRHDFGEIISVAVTAAAANLGGTEALLAGRPGSWEANHVRQIINSTTPERELGRYRTEPIMLLLDPESIFEDTGLRYLFDEEDSELGSSYAIGTELYDDGTTDADTNARRNALVDRYNVALDSYFADYVDSIRLAAAERGLTVPVTVKRVVDYRVVPSGDPLVDALHATARARTPLPGAVLSN